MTRSTTTVLALVGLSTFALGAAGCSMAPTYRFDKTATAPHTAGMPLAVATRNGAISISEHAGQAVEITAHLKSKDEARVLDAVIDAVRGPDGTLSIGVTWPDGKWHSNDGCSFEIFVPDANGISAQSSNGSITIVGLSGGVDAHTSNGSVTVNGHDGAISIDTSNGRITVDDAIGSVHAGTSNGSIKVALTDDNPGPVRLGTSNGSVTLAIGPAFRGTLTANTSNGSVTFGPFPDDLATSGQSISKSFGTLSFGAGEGDKSVAATSNGSITIKGKG